MSSWFLTKAGRKFSLGCTCFAAGGLLGFNFLSETWFLEKYREIIQSYDSGLPVAVPQIIKERIEQSASLLNLSEVERNRIKPFIIFGFDIYHIGNVYSKFGSYIGVPINFSYSTADDADKKNILVNNNYIDWSTSEAKSLLNSLILSEKAQLFAISREIVNLKSPKIIIDVITAPLCILMAFAGARNFNTRFDLYSRPVLVRGVIYSLISAFAYGVYSFMTDFCQINFETSVDKHLCEINSLYIQGGKEFYDKMIQRNIALYKLMGKKGEKLYTVHGNEKYMLRQKHLPNTLRREIFAERMKQINLGEAAH